MLPSVANRCTRLWVSPRGQPWGSLEDTPISSSRIEIASVVDCMFMKLRSIMGISFVTKSYCKTSEILTIARQISFLRHRFWHRVWPDQSSDIGGKSTGLKFERWRDESTFVNTPLKRPVPRFGIGTVNFFTIGLLQKQQPDYSRSGNLCNSQWYGPQDQTIKQILCQFSVIFNQKWRAVEYQHLQWQFITICTSEEESEGVKSAD